MTIARLRYKRKKRTPWNRRKEFSRGKEGSNHIEDFYSKDDSWEKSTCTFKYILLYRQPQDLYHHLLHTHQQLPALLANRDMGAFDIEDLLGHDDITVLPPPPVHKSVDDVDNLAVRLDKMTLDSKLDLSEHPANGLLNHQQALVKSTTEPSPQPPEQPPHQHFQTASDPTTPSASISASTLAFKRSTKRTFNLYQPPRPPHLGPLLNPNPNSDWNPQWLRLR